MKIVGILGSRRYWVSFDGETKVQPIIALVLLFLK